MAMSVELNFEAIPLEYDGYRRLASEQSGFELEEEYSRRGRVRSPGRGFAPRAPRIMSRQPATPPVPQPAKTKRPPYPPPRIPPYPRWRGVIAPYGVAPEPYPVVPEPYPAEPAPTGSEYIRWVQSALNDALGLQLPLHGIADEPTRDAIRSFQRREQLPADGVVGPDTERALLAARSGTSPQQAAPGSAWPSEPAPAAPAGELNFESESVEHEFDGARTTDERAAVKSRVAAGQRDPNALTDMLFFQRHPERRGRRLRPDEYKLVHEWKAILRRVVLPELTHIPAESATGAKVSDSDVAATQAMAAKPVPGLGISLEELLLRHRAEAGGIPVELLLAFIYREAGTNRRGEARFSDATAGYWMKDKKTGKPFRYAPTPKFYELGLFQTPAGLHGCVPVGDKGMERSCKYKPPGHNVENSEFGKGWRLFTRTYPNESNWTDPETQVRIGLWSLNRQADAIRTDQEFMPLFPSKQSEWSLRMAVLYSFAAGAGWTRAFLHKYKNDLLALSEDKRWRFLSGKRASRINPETKQVDTKVFDPENVDKKMALAAKFRAVRRSTTTQPLGEPR
jgi:peptidoglycan hydrolase-like protein with peptidoglycan-binding domain